MSEWQSIKLKRGHCTVVNLKKKCPKFLGPVMLAGGIKSVSKSVQR